MSSFTFNGVSSESFDFLKINKITTSLLPPVRQRIQTVVGRDGAYHYGRDLEPLTHQIEITVKGYDRETLAAQKRELAKWLLTDSPKPLVYSYEPDKTYMAVLSGDTNLDEIIGIGKTTLTFIIVDPFALGEEQSQTIAGIPKVEQDVDTTAEFQNGTLTNLVLLDNAVILDREGQNYSKNVTDFSTGGTHSDTTADSNNDLILSASYTPHQDVYDINYSTGTLDGCIFDPFEMVLVMNNLPSYSSNALDFMNNVDTVNDWQLYTDPADPGTVTFTQNAGYYTMDALDMDGAIRRMTATFTFPVTVDFVYRLSASDPNASNPVRVDARVIYDGRMFSAQLGDTGGQWCFGRIVVHNSSQADWYINGVRQGSLTGTNTSLTDRVQFFTDQAWQAKLDLAYFGMVSEARTTYQQSSYPFPTVATYTSDPIPLDGTSDLYTDSEINFTAQTGSIFTGFESSVTVEVDIYKNGAWQGYQVVNDGDPLPYLNSGDNLTGVQARFRVTLSAYAIDEELTTPNVSPITASVDGQISSYQTSGSFESDADAGIQQVGKASQTSITWDDHVPSGTSVTCSVSFSGGSWQTVNKGDPIPGITPTTDLSTADLKVKFDLSTNDPTITPKVFSYEYELISGFHDQGERIGGEYLDLSQLEDIGDSYIGWDTTPDGTSDVEVYVEVTDQTSPTGNWTKVEINPSKIPGIVPGDNSLLDKRVFCRQVLKSPTKKISPILHQVLYSVSGAGGGQIIYNGSAKSYPVITVEFLQDVDFDTQPFEIVHMQTGSRLLFNSDFIAGVDQLVIDCVKGVVKLNGVNALNLLSIESDFLYFVEGVNDFVISPEGSAMVEFVWRERFV